MALPLGGQVIKGLYVAAFGGAAVVCFASLFRTERIDDDDIRRGLGALLLTSGLWAGAHVSRLVGSDPSLKVTFYLVGLAAGFATPFAWLYFCSAYTGHDYHRTPAYRRVALAVYGGVVLLKFTNPIHGRYFATGFETAPFPHLVVQLGTLHWIVTGLAYVLSGIGFYMLFELFVEIEYDTTVLAFLFALTGLPVVLDLVGYLSPGVIITLNYEPLGVALFAVGVLYVTERTFLAVPRVGRQQLIDSLSESVLFLDVEGRLIDANRTATDRLPGVAAGIGEPLGQTLPVLSDPAAADGDVVTLEGPDPDRPTHYLVRVTPLTTGGTTLGRAVVLSDVTDVERQRRELRRQNEQLDGFAAAVAHELRNGLGIVGGNLELLAETVQSGDPEEAAELLDTVSETTREMEQVVADLSVLARLSQTVADAPLREFRPAVEAAWQGVRPTAGEIELEAVGGGRLEVEERRLAELLRNVGRIARELDARAVTVALGESALSVSLAGATVGEADPEGVFEYGTADPDAETGMLFANVQALARAHGWSVRLETGRPGGFELVFEGVVTETGAAPGEHGEHARADQPDGHGQADQPDEHGHKNPTGERSGDAERPADESLRGGREDEDRHGEPGSEDRPEHPADESSGRTGRPADESSR